MTAVIDLSVGSMLSLVAVAGAVLQVYHLAPSMGVGHPAIWIIAIVAILALGTAIGAFNGYLTAYAHNQALLVKEDQTVRKGQKIAEMGSSDADRVKLHFEIRRQGKPVDPARYLPPR